MSRENHGHVDVGSKIVAAGRPSSSTSFVVDPSTHHIRGLIYNPAVESTHHISILNRKMISRVALLLACLLSSASAFAPALGEFFVEIFDVRLASDLDWMPFELFA